MRQKLYYTAAETQSNLYTGGLEWMLTDGTEYKGLYHRYLTGEVFTEAVWNTKSKPLIPYTKSTNHTTYKTLKPDIQTKYQTPSPHYINITKSDIKTGYITRYFLEKINTKQVIEISKDTLKSKQYDLNLYQSVTLNWKITGNIETTNVNGVLVLGVIDHNRRQIQENKKYVSKLDIYLPNPLQFYVDTNLNVPSDIN